MCKLKMNKYIYVCMYVYEGKLIMPRHMHKPHITKSTAIA